MRRRSYDEVTTMKRILIISLAVLVLLPFGFGSWSCSPREYSGPVESITIGSVPVLPWQFTVAEDRMLFADNGLEVVMKTYDTGADTVTAAAKGDVDVAATGEYPIVVQAFAGQSVSRVGNYDRTSRGQAENSLFAQFCPENRAWTTSIFR